MDSALNVYVTGHSSGDFLTIKYSLLGAPLWHSRYGGKSRGIDEPRALALDRAGNVYVTGDAYGGDALNGGTGMDCETVKYDPNGRELWSRAFTRVSFYGKESGRAIAVGPTGEVYVAAASPGQPSYQDYWTVKYDSRGKEAWAQRYNGEASNDDILNAVAVDGLGNVVVSGISTVFTGPQNANPTGICISIKYSAQGKPLWCHRFAPAGYPLTTHTMTMDRNGSPVIAAQVGRPDGKRTIMLFKYRPKSAPK